MEPPRWEEIEAAFSELVALDAVARRERLAALGATDPALRAAVEALLAADAEAETRLAPLAASLVAPVDDLGRLTATLAGRYRFERELGRGGMATVYLAHDLKHDRAVALKVLKPELAAALGRERFLREVAFTARLDHPHIVPLLDSGEAGELVYYVMPHVEGESLRDRLEREKQLSVADALQITHEVADALDYAHSHGIIHRDIKPANILLGGGHARVADFGIARAVTAAGREQLTETGIAVGTPAYMSPEQATGSADLDGRSDVYSLGCVLYEMLAGHPPFTGSTAQEILARHSVDAVPVLGAARPTVPHSIEQVIHMALGKVPADRFATARQFAEALRTGAPSSAPVVTAGRVRSVRRLVFTVAAVVGVVATAAAAILQRNRARRDAGAGSPVVVMPFENHTGDHSLDPVSAIAADWVAQGLTEPGFLAVRDTRSALAAAAQLGVGASPVAVGRETGAAVVIAGSYFLRGDSLQFLARVVSATDGTILRPIGPVAAARDRPLDGVEEVREHALAALAALHDKDVSTFQTVLVTPPTYAAYREYTEGLAFYMRRDYAEALRHFERGAVLDSSFLTARVWAAQTALWAQPDTARRLLAELGPLRDHLTPFDRARFDFITAIYGPGWNPDGAYVGADLEGAYRAALRMVDAAPGSLDAQREAALSALRVLRPHESLRWLQKLDSERGLMREWSGYWSALTLAYHMLGRYEDELTAARRGRALFPSRWPQLRDELRALAGLGRLDELDSLVHADLPTPGSRWSTQVAYIIAGELLAHEHAEAAQRLARWELDRSRTHTMAESAASPEQDEWLHLQIELALLLGDTETATKLVARFYDPEAHGWLRARILTLRGQRDEARATLEQAQRRDAAASGTSLRGFEIVRAGVLVSLGDLDGAIAVLKGRAGFPFMFGLYLPDEEDGHATPALAPLWSDPRFQELIKPKG